MFKATKFGMICYTATESKNKTFLLNTCVFINYYIALTYFCDLEYIFPNL